VNLIKAQCWDETPEAIKKDAPFELTWWVKFWESVQFAKHDWSKVVLSSFLPFISEMASNHPTVEKDNNRQFFVEYLNKLWKSDHTS
jgi:hypothetical protein